MTENNNLLTYFRYHNLITSMKKCDRSQQQITKNKAKTKIEKILDRTNNIEIVELSDNRLIYLEQVYKHITVCI